jgi:hypothetical protein
VGGDGGGSTAHSHGGDVNQGGLIDLNVLSPQRGGDSTAVSQGGNGGAGGGHGAGGHGAGGHGAGGHGAGGHGGNGGDADVHASQDTVVVNEFDHSFNEDNHTTHIDHSFNQDNDTTYIDRSFNEDNDGVDNKDGHIYDSVVAGDDIENSFNDDDTVINDSFKEDNDFLDLDVVRDINVEL